MSVIKLSQYGKIHGVTYRTVWRWFQEGRIPGAYRIGKSIFVPKTSVSPVVEHTIIYARVSSSENKDNLDSQADRLSQFCAAKGWVVHQIIKECASGLNDTRPKLQKLLKEKKVTRLVVEHKDRLTRFGFNYIQTLLDKCEIVVINQVDGAASKDLMEDFISLVTSFCARIYGRRRSKRLTEKLIQDVSKNPNGQKEI